MYAKNSFDEKSSLSQVMAWCCQATRSTRMPAFWEYPPLPHDYPYYWFILDPSHPWKSQSYKSKELICQNFKFWNKFYMWLTTWRCLIRCVYMKWVPWQGEIPPFNFIECGGGGGGGGGPLWPGPCIVNWLQLIERPCTHRWNLQVPVLQISCCDLN